MRACAAQLSIECANVVSLCRNVDENDGKLECVVKSKRRREVYFSVISVVAPPRIFHPVLCIFYLIFPLKRDISLESVFARLMCVKRV